MRACALVPVCAHVCVCLRVRACGVARVRARHVCRIVRACLLVLVMGTLSQSSLTPFVRPSLATLSVLSPRYRGGVCGRWLAFFALGWCLLSLVLPSLSLFGLSVVLPELSPSVL